MSLYIEDKVYLGNSGEGPKGGNAPVKFSSGGKGQSRRKTPEDRKPKSQLGGEAPLLSKTA